MTLAVKVEKLFTHILELLDIPLMRFTWPVTWEVCRSDICDGFLIDIDNLQ